MIILPRILKDMIYWLIDYVIYCLIQRYDLLIN